MSLSYPLLTCACCLDGFLSMPVGDKRTQIRHRVKQRAARLPERWCPHALTNSNPLFLFNELMDNEIGRAYRCGRFSTKRIGSPVASAPSSSSHMARWPRTTVPMGQPFTFMPLYGVQPHFEAIHLSSMMRSAFISTMVRSAS